jgi:hypothetical protein
MALENQNGKHINKIVKYRGKLFGASLVGFKRVTTREARM